MRPQLAGQCPVDQGAVVVHQARQRPQVNDGAVTCRCKIDNLADGGGALVTSDDEGAWRDLGRVAGRVEERQLPTLGALQADREVGPLRGSQELEPALAELASRRR